ncbi:MFS transporter [Novosphingobium guangzhouense]|uniref:MFS transporter n=1 Tax=Novosphingobium guangzhouense TaxID=1850347 RepID=A0A2K2FW90_9SPHN|nr:MFS transporter [Novosphingobium guangzhouense]PNU03056.1 MFS transporter [Novosphingobium guangzhouense]
MSQPSRTSPPHGLALAQIALGFGGLFIGTGEFAAMGLLPGMANTAGVSIPKAGHFISAYALGVVIGSPALAVMTARMEKRRQLMLLGVLVLAGNALSALASDFCGLAAARFVAGLPHGAYYGTASIVAAALVPKQQRAQAIGRVMLGLAAANLIGVPLTTWLGQAFGWQSTFALVALGGLALLGILRLAIPQVPARDGASPLGELSAFASGQVWLTLATATIGFGGMFAVYSYITPTLTEATGVGEGSVPLFLALWGLGMCVGNVAGGWLADRALIPAIFAIMLWNAVFLALFWFAAPSPMMAGVSLFFIGVGFALVPALQSRLMEVAPKAQSLAAAMNHSAFNLSNAIGAWTGGLAISAGLGWASTGPVGAGLAVGGLVIMGLSALLTKRSNFTEKTI